MPNGIQGGYKVVVETNATGTVNEGLTGAGNDTTPSAVMNVSLAPYSDLSVGDVTAPSLVIGNPVTITVSWQVTNNGTGPGTTSQWDDRVVLSTSPVFGQGTETDLGDYPHDGALAVGATYTETENIQVPPGTTGQFYLFVETDALHQVYQYTNTQPDIGSPSNTVDIIPEPYSALDVSDVTADATALSGQPINLSWTVANNGIGATDQVQWNDNVYVSSDPTGATGMQFLGSFTHVGALGVGDGYTRNVQVTLPEALSGTQYLFVETGGPYQFIYTSGDQGRSGPVQVTYVPPPAVNLDVLSVTGPTTALDSSTALVTWTVENNGPDDASGFWTDSVYLAPNGNFSQAVDLGDFQYTYGLQAGKQYTRTEQVTLPSTPGIYEFYVLADSGKVLADTNFASNLLASAPLTITLTPRPDLEVTSLTVPQLVTEAGVVDVQWQVTNLGQAATPTGQSQWTDAVYLSQTNTLQAGAILLGTLPNGTALGVGQSYASSDQFTLPVGIAGNVYIIVEADSQDQVNEGPLHGNNTTAAAMAVNASRPAARPGDVERLRAFDGFDGNDITVHYQVTNLGTGPTYPSSWSDAIWLTLGKDQPDPQRGDILLGQFGHSGCSRSASRDVNNVTVEIPPQVGRLLHHGLDRRGPVGVRGAVRRQQEPRRAERPARRQFPGHADPGADHASRRPAGDQHHGPAHGHRRPGCNHFLASDQQRSEPDQRWRVGRCDLHQQHPGPDGRSHAGLCRAARRRAGAGAVLRPDGDVHAAAFGSRPVLCRGNQRRPRSGGGSGRRRAVPAGDPAGGQSGWRHDQWANDQQPHGPGHPGPPERRRWHRPDDRVRGPVRQQQYGGRRERHHEHAGRPGRERRDGAAQSNSGEPINVTWQVTNQGADVWSGTQYWNDYVFVSPDPEFIYNDATLGAVVPHSNANNLASGESYTGSATVTLPAGISGTWYVYVFTDRDPVNGEDVPQAGAFPEWPQEFQSRVWDTDKTHSESSTSLNVIYAEPELVISNVTAAGTATSGATVPISFTVTNDGNRTTRVDTWFDRVYIATDSSLDTQDELLGTFEHQGYLAPGQSYNVTGTVTLPDDIGGTFYLIFYADSPFTAAGPVYKGIYPFPESGGDPRIGGGGPGLVDCYLNGYLKIESQPIQVTLVDLPDLVVSSVTSSSEVTVGQAFSVTYTVSNIGSGPVPADEATWPDNIYLSLDQYLDVETAIFLGSIKHTVRWRPTGSIRSRRYLTCRRA